MAFCHTCGHQVGESAKFCASCGAVLRTDQDSENQDSQVSGFNQPQSLYAQPVKPPKQTKELMYWGIGAAVVLVLGLLAWIFLFPKNAIAGTYKTHSESNSWRYDFELVVAPDNKANYAVTISDVDDPDYKIKYDLETVISENRDGRYQLHNKPEEITFKVTFGSMAVFIEEFGVQSGLSDVLSKVATMNLEEIKPTLKTFFVTAGAPAAQVDSLLAGLNQEGSQIVFKFKLPDLQKVFESLKLDYNEWLLLSEFTEDTITISKESEQILRMLWTQQNNFRDLMKEIK